MYMCVCVGGVFYKTQSLPEIFLDMEYIYIYIF